MSNQKATDPISNFGGKEKSLKYLTLMYEDATQREVTQRVDLILQLYTAASSSVQWQEMQQSQRQELADFVHEMKQTIYACHDLYKDPDTQVK